MSAKVWKWTLDLGLLLGAAVFVYGLSLAWRPLGFIIAGLLLALGCFFAAYDRERRELRKGGTH